jgi:hypothetical protein
VTEPVSPSDTAQAARVTLGLSVAALWLDSLSLGGNLTPTEIAAFLSGRDVLSDHEHDVLIHALNERFTDRNENHPLAYASDPPPAA